MIIMPQEFLTIEEISQLLRLSEETVKRLLRSKQLPGYKIGGSWRVDKEDFDKYMARSRNIQKDKETN